MHHRRRSAFALIELLVVIAIIAILAIIVILVLNPAELFRQSRDANRLSDTATLNAALGVYAEDMGGSMGNGSITAISIPDSTTATTTAGDQCQGLGLASVSTSTGQNYQCAASSTPRKINGTGWVPINFSLIASGAPIGNLPVDPLSQTSTNFFYTYTGNGTQYEVTSILESQKYRTQYGVAAPITTYPRVIGAGNTLSISNLFNPNGLVGYWPMDEGTGSSTSDLSGNSEKGTWVGTSAGTAGYYSSGKVGNWSGTFDGSSNYIAVTSTPALQSVSSTGSISVWMNFAVTTTTTRFILDLGGTGFQGLDLAGTSGAGLQPYLQYGTGASTNLLYIAAATDSTWYLVTVTWSPAGAQTYLNGVAKLASPTAPSIVIYPTTIYIGANSGNQRYMIGSLDDLRVYNYALSPAQILAIYNSEK